MSTPSSTGQANPDTPHPARLIFALWQLRKLLPAMLDHELEPLGITMPGFGVLNALDMHGPMSGADLARWEDVRPQTMATLLGALVRDGLVERRPHPVHGRVQLATLTTRGGGVFRDASEHVGRVEARLHDTLGTTGHATMRTQTWALVDALAHDSHPRHGDPEP